MRVEVALGGEAIPLISSLKGWKLPGLLDLEWLKIFAGDVFSMRLGATLHTYITHMLHFHPNE